MKYKRGLIFAYGMTVAGTSGNDNQKFVILSATKARYLGTNQGSFSFKKSDLTSRYKYVGEVKNIPKARSIWQTTTGGLVKIKKCTRDLIVYYNNCDYYGNKISGTQLICLASNPNWLLHEVNPSKPTKVRCFWCHQEP